MRGYETGVETLLEPEKASPLPGGWDAAEFKPGPWRDAYRPSGLDPDLLKMCIASNGRYYRDPLPVRAAQRAIRLLDHLRERRRSGRPARP